MTNQNTPSDSSGASDPDPRSDSAATEVPWADISDNSRPDDGRADKGPRQVIAGATAVIEPLAYCRQCPHFTAEPDAGCRHESARILEVLRDGRFHVFDCPVVTADGPAFDRGQRD